MESIGKNGNSENHSEDSDALTVEQIATHVYLVRRAAMRQVVYGLLWWSGSSIAMYFALQSTGDSFYYYGGALGSLFHWYRAIKMFMAIRQVGASRFMSAEKVLISATIAIILVTSISIIPTYFKVSNPGLGTCWAENGTADMLVPVACWGSNASYKAVDLTNTPEECPEFASIYLEPSYGDSRYTCLAQN